MASSPRVLLSNGSGGMVVSQGKVRAASPSREDSGNDSDGTAAAGTKGDATGSSYRKRPVLEDFEMIKTIGTGTFGRVCLCRDRSGAFHAMKILEISDVIRLKQVEHVKNEKAILLQVQHPFIIRMSWTHHDATCLYMLFEYVSGGELFTYLRNAGRFTSATGSFYAAEIVLALEYLHRMHIVYRDLKPENLLLDREGHLKITDFGFAKKLHDRTWTLCGTPEYLAPEIIQSKGHNRAVDWWALGVLIYEMLAGYPPYFDDNPFAIYEKILAGKVEWPRHIDPVAKDLIKKLLVNDRTKRLGSMKNGAEDVKRHRWFKGTNWEDVLEKKLKPPIVPRVAHDGDTRYFDRCPESKVVPSEHGLTPKELALFDDF
ncbi:cAMP-dependent protein kinase catalytic subunit 3 isoform X2 [Dermacentor andersoni]|uniref:cAMP-dependent protein kinase catalytic subunit 3 isoform X2 n=1 Tax=Dermacentor andersoni TaxID=34620 RepID=UPI0021557C2C|nr:cAMP-dependent protein kinase catalytic subunit 3-like isoform X2 [Dermacentor andersoni]